MLLQVRLVGYFYHFVNMFEQTGWRDQNVLEREVSVILSGKNVCRRKEGYRNARKHESEDTEKCPSISFFLCRFTREYTDTGTNDEAGLREEKKGGKRKGGKEERRKGRENG